MTLSEEQCYLTHQNMSCTLFLPEQRHFPKQDVLSTASQVTTTNSEGMPFHNGNGSLLDNN